MRFLWILADDRPDYGRAQAHGITGFYFDPRDPWANRANLSDVRARGYQVGIYGAWNWPDVGSHGRDFADWMHGEAARLTDGSPTFPRVQFDIEAHDPGYVSSCLSRWRVLEPGRATSWTLEPFQGGWVAGIAGVVASAKTRVSPQLYFGNMAPAAADRVVFDLEAAGIARPALSSMYDAAALPGGWDGFAFHQGRLPPS